MPATSSTPTSQNRTWAFPYGPSAKYHTREKTAAPQHTRTKSSYTPIAPVLSTERRAHHRRTQTQKSSISVSPQSEYTRSPLSRFSSYTHSMAHLPPSTPAKPHRRSSSVQNSPFSDYFTDDARSVDSNAPPSDTKQLLVRMNKLQSKLMRDSGSGAGQESIRIVATKLDEIEREFGALHAQMNAPSCRVEDSGIFTDEEEPDSKNHAGSQPYLDTENGSMELSPEPRSIEEFKAERDWFILRTQELLDGLRLTQTELGKRFAEVRELNGEHNAQLEERDTHIERLRSENEGLRSDLGFEYSELLFLKLQMKSLEVDVDSIPEESISSATAASSEKSAKKNRILSEMDRWRSDWQDVEGRFNRRRSRYGLSPERRDSLSIDGEASSPTGEAEWHLQTVKEGHGRVTSLTIKRMDSTFGVGVEQSSAFADPLRTHDSDDSTPRPNRKQESCPTMNSDTTTQGPEREPQIAISQHKYVAHGTQTEDHYSLSEHHEYEHDLFLAEEEQYDHQDEPQQGEDESEEDCAITTSSETSDAGVDDEPQKPEPTPKTAWQELWESLQNLTGIDDRFED